MDEAKSLVNMAVAAMFAAMILAAAMGLIYLGYQMWSYFSRQDAANERMTDYVNYTAYDCSTIRGQEAVSLIEYCRDNGKFVCIMEGLDSTTTNPNINVMVNNTGIKYYVFGTDVNFDWTFDTRYLTTLANTTCNKGLSTFASACSTNPISGMSGVNTLNFVTQADQCTYDALIGMFLDSDDGNTWSFGRTSKSKTYPDGTIETNYVKAGYSAFKSVLIYDNDTTTDIAGVLLIEEGPNTIEYN